MIFNVNILKLINAKIYFNWVGDSNNSIFNNALLVKIY